jgi:hypothetical protein
VIVINTGDISADCHVIIPGLQNFLLVTPENPDSLKTDGNIIIHARSAAVIMEE